MVSSVWWRMLSPLIMKIVFLLLSVFPVGKASFEMQDDGAGQRTCVTACLTGSRSHPESFHF